MPPPAMPMMPRIERYAHLITACDRSAPLQSLLVAVVAPLAHRLPVLSVPKQCAVAAMRDDMIDHLRRRNATASLAFDAEFSPAICRTRFLPTPVV
jgi:hypothetical protein